MSRRDTIIIAVLINAGLLVVLFSTALKSNKNEEIAAIAAEQTPVAQVTELPVQHATPVANTTQDEVDQLLRQYASPIVAEASPSTAPVEPPKNDFAQDLNTFAAAPLAAKQPASLPVSRAATEVVVKKGDVLEKIARTHHTTVEAIMKTNHLTSTRLKIGQVLKVSEGTASKKSNVQERSDVEAKYYTVKNGDNPWTIAVKNHIKVDELLRLNNLDAEKAKRLKPGDQLRIR
jgi:peptidoglycan DL-endopeptidase LytF